MELLKLLVIKSTFFLYFISNKLYSFGVKTSGVLPFNILTFNKNAY
jgi:hypothetical protein